MSRARVIGTLVIAALACGVALWLGLQTEFAVSVGIVAAAVGVVLRTPFGDDARAGGPTTEPQDVHRGSEVSRLAWAVKPRDNTVGEMVSRRVRATLRRRLASHDLDPDRPDDRAEIDRRLGAGLWDRLAGRRASPSDIHAALDAADALIDPAAPQHAVESERPQRRRSRT